LPATPTIGNDAMNPDAPRLCLASASPRRAALLRQIGVAHCVVRPEVDESSRPGEPVEALVQRLAEAKARAGLALRPEGFVGPVLGADTLVVLDGEPLGKPAGRDEALAMLERLSGRTHEVLTAVSLADADRSEVRLSRSEVRFRVIPPQERAAYWATGEPRDKAGGYAIQGLGAIFVADLVGSYSGVMGLPLFETAELLDRFGVPVLQP